MEDLNFRICSGAKTLSSFISLRRFGKGKQTKRRGIGEEKMVLSTAKTQLSRFEKIAPDKKFELGELKSNGRYIHILRDGKIIGCFARDKNGTIIFEHHNSYPEGRKRVPVSELTDNNIKDIIHRTRGRKPRT